MATQEIDTSNVGNSEQPRGEGTLVVEGVKLPIGLEQGILDNILAVHNRPGHTSTVTAQAGARVGDRFKKRQVACLEGPGCAHIARIIHIYLYPANSLWDTD